MVEVTQIRAVSRLDNIGPSSSGGRCEPLVLKDRDRCAALAVLCNTTYVELVVGLAGYHSVYMPLAATDLDTHAQAILRGKTFVATTQADGETLGRKSKVLCL